MKKLAYLALGALLALGSVACGGNNNNNNNNNDPSKKDPGYQQPTSTAKNLELGAECTPSLSDPCKQGLKCTEISAFDVALCMQTCTTSADCPDGMVCGQAKETNSYEFEGLCVDKLPNYAFCLADGYPAQCGENAICTEGVNYRDGSYQIYYASYFFADAGKDDPLYMLGFCSPLCNTSTNNCPQPSESGLVTNAKDADMFNFAWWGMAETTMSCVPMFNGNGAGICADATPRSEFHYCDGNIVTCGGGIDGASDEGVADCFPDDILFDGSIENKEVQSSGMYTGYDELDRLYGMCFVLCEHHAVCACAEGSTNVNCQGLEANQFRSCFYLHKDGAADKSNDRGGYCTKFTKCQTKDDCNPEYHVDCINPADGYTIGGAHFSFPADIPTDSKICI